MVRWAWSAGVALWGIFAAGCAGYTLQKDGTGEGYDVYAPAPYLLQTFEKDVARFQVIYLPDYSRRYRVKTWAGLGQAGMTFTFKDGWQLQGIEDKSNNTKVAEGVATLADVIMKLVPIPRTPYGTEEEKAGAAPRSVVAEPVLYKIAFDERNGEPCGLRRVCAVECGGGAR